MPKNIDATALDLISKLLVKNPETRLGAKSILEVIDHPFFDGINFNTIGTELPPEKFELTPLQVKMVNYLPHNKQKLQKGFSQKVINVEN